jgi:GT2 family glycosyltransferase
MSAPFDDLRVVGVKGALRTDQHALIARLTQLEYDFRYERMARATAIDFVDTGAGAYRRDILLEHGGFDPLYTVPSAEDIDLSFRLARAGHLMVFAPDALVWHPHPASLRGYLVRKARYGFWRALLYLRYPEKIGGDTHTDPGLKLQFALIALLGLLALGGLFWRPLLWGAGAALVGFLVTTLGFARWAWSRDRAVALTWSLVTLLRVVAQGVMLAAGFAWHGVVARQNVRRTI